jgi:hypothetical protein
MFQQQLYSLMFCIMYIVSTELVIPYDMLYIYIPIYKKKKNIKYLFKYSRYVVFILLTDVGQHRRAIHSN